MSDELPQHYQNVIENMREVDRLVTYYAKLSSESTKKQSTQREANILNRSAVVLLVACWEAYVEDLAEAALTAILEEADSPEVFPSKVLQRVASAHQGDKAWKLAGDGWRACIRSNFREVLAHTIGKLNTPRAAQVDDLFVKTIGLEHISNTWHWKGRSAASSRTSLDDLVTLRGSIAHRVQAGRPVYKKNVTDASELVKRLAVCSGNAVRAHVQDLTGFTPWKKYTRGSAK